MSSSSNQSINLNQNANKQRQYQEKYPDWKQKQTLFKKRNSNISADYSTDLAKDKSTHEYFLQDKERRSILIQEFISDSSDLLLSLGNYSFSVEQKKIIFNTFLDKLEELLRIYNTENFFNVKENLF